MVIVLLVQSFFLIYSFDCCPLLERIWMDTVQMINSSADFSFENILCSVGLFSDFFFVNPFYLTDSAFHNFKLYLFSFLDECLIISWYGSSVPFVASCFPLFINRFLDSELIFNVILKILAVRNCSFLLFIFRRCFIKWLILFVTF